MKARGDTAPLRHPWAAGDGEQGREMMRKLLEEHLALRGGGPAAEAVVGEDGVERTHKRRRPRQVITTLGEVEVERIGYGQRDVDSRFVLDAALGLPPDSYSQGLRRRLAFEAARGSFDDAVEAVERATGTRVGKRQAEELVQRAAVDFEAFYATREPAANGQTGEILVITTDGKGVSMRRDALRPATRKAAEERRPRLEKRVCKGEKTATRRMAQVAAVYSIQPYVRTAEEIAGTLGPSATESSAAVARPRPQQKRVWASVCSDAWAVMRRSATKRGLLPARLRAVDRCADYLLKYAEYLRYDEYLAAGFPISTGVIEGACRYLVKDRMDITGARWGLDGAEAVLRLRALKASGDFDAYWAFHEHQELRRNHLVRYAHETLPKLRKPHPLRRKTDLSVVP